MHRPRLSSLVNNSAWLFSEQMLRMAISMVTGVLIARYLGPNQFGWLSFAIAVVGFITSLTSMGLNAVVVREIARAPQEENVLIGTVFILRLVGAVSGFLLCAAGSIFTGNGLDVEKILVLITGLGLIFQAFDVIDLVFQAHRRARISAWIRMGAFSIGGLVKVLLIVLHAPVFAFALAIVAELALCAIGWTASIVVCKWKVREWRFERDYASRLLRESWPLAVSGIAIYAQAYADQVVIGMMLGSSDLGQYAAAMRWITAIAFIPLVIQTVAAPEIAIAKTQNEEVYKMRLHQLYCVMMLAFFLTAVPLALLGPALTHLLYGKSFGAAAALLPLLSLRQFFTNFGLARAIFITNDRLLRFSLATAVAGAIVNILLNLALIPRFGMQGAIVSSLASYTVATFALDWLHPKALVNLKLMLRAAAAPWKGLKTVELAR